MNAATSPDHEVPGSPLAGNTTSVGAVSGPANTGSGDQHNHFHGVGVAGAYTEVGEGRLRPRAVRVVTAEQRGRHEESFVADREFPRARDLLMGKGRTVILSGPSGSGRRTAALRLLDMVGESESRVRFRELADVDFEVSASVGDILASNTVKPRERVLLDLSGNPELLSRIRPILETYRAEIQAADAFLAVVIGQDQEDEVRDEFGELIVPLKRPDGVRALGRHLRAQGVGIEDGWLASRPIADWAAHARLGEIAHLARLARDARSASPNASVDDWLSAAQKALAERRPEVVRKVNGLSDSWERALLLSAALLDGRNADAVLTAAQELMSILATPIPEVPPLEREVFRTQLARLDVLILPDRTVAFSGLGYADAVRECLWDGHPDLGHHFVTWVDRCIRDPRMAPIDRDVIAERLMEQCLRTGSFKVLFAQIRRWATDGTQGRSLALQAAHVLGRVLNDPDAGRTARHQVYRWAREDRLPDALAQVLIAVCVGVIAVNQPDEALVRLHHLARRCQAEARSSAVDALLDLTAKPRMYRQLLTRLADAADRDRAAWEADHELLWLLTEPSRLMAQELAGPLTVRRWPRDDLVVALADAIADDREVRRHVGRALQAQAETGESAFLLDILVEAGTTADRLNVLYSAAFRWAHGPDAGGTPDAKSRAARALISRIDRAQGWTDADARAS